MDEFFSFLFSPMPEKEVGKLILFKASKRMCGRRYQPSPHKRVFKYQRSS